MALSRLHTLYGVKVEPDSISGSAVMLGGIRRQSIRTGIDVRQETVSGAVYSQAQYVHATAPGMDFSTVSLARAIDCIGSTGLAITAAAAGTGVTAYGFKKSEGGTRMALASNHISYNFKEGILVPRRISCSHQDDAVLDLEMLATYDGTNAPVVTSNAATAPTNGVDDQRYTIGPVQLGTVTGDKITLSQIQSLEIDFGIMATVEGSDSDIYPTYSVINEIPRPSIRFTTNDMTLLALASGLPLQGKDIDLSHTIIYLRKRQRVTATGYVADGTATHISIVPAAGCAYITQLADYGSSSGNGTLQVEIPLIWDITNPPWTWSTTAAISFPA